jgi:hypothetical protein
MIRRGLLCVALLFAIIALPLRGAAQAAASEPETGSTQPDNTTQPEAGGAQPQAALPPFHIDCAPASRAYTLIGEHGCVAGRVFRVVHTRQGNMRLYLCPSRRQCTFHATVKSADRKNVGDLWYLRGRVVAIVGDIIDFHDSPEIVITDKGQIQIAAEDTPQEFDAAEPRPIGGRHGNRHKRAW